MTWTAEGTLYDKRVRLVWDADGPSADHPYPTLLGLTVDRLTGLSVEFAPGVSPLVVRRDDPRSWLAVLMSEGTLTTLTGDGAPLMVPPLPDGTVG